MSAKRTAEAVDPAPDRQPCFLGRWGRGRIGGTAARMLLGQRARAQARSVKFLDGDLKSGTLSAFYNGECSRPLSLDSVDFRGWVLEHLDRMEEDRVSRLLNVSGGSSSMEELLRKLELPEFCEATFSDTLAAVRREFWREQGFAMYHPASNMQKLRPALREGITYALCNAA